MKVLYISNGLTHYYNLVLSRLNNEATINLVVAAPAGIGGSIGDGVYQTKEGINFRIIELREKRKLKFYSTFEGLARVLRQERPDIIITLEPYLPAFLFDISLVLAVKSIRSAIILKSIPFRYITFQESMKAIEESNIGFSSLPSFVNKMLGKLGLIRTVRRILLYITRVVFNIPSAHVNYVEAYEYWESYGVPKEKIFITRNSPDTDLLFSMREKIEREQGILPRNPYRLLHVGRLVEWKRVDMLLRAFARVKESFPDSELLIIGNGPEEDNLMDLVGELKLSNSVKFLGGIYEEEILAKYYLGSALYVLAGMGGLSINEAMSFGLPVLCSVCDGTEKALVKEGVNGRYFKDGDEDDLVEKIIWFLERPSQTREMGFQSEEVIRNEVNINTVINGYLDAINYVARQKDLDA